MSKQDHQSDPRVLSRRTLGQDHRVLAGLLKPGMQVLDVGCGTGSITAGIAERVGDSGFVMGLDRDESLLAIARKDHGHLGHLHFENRDVLDICQGDFDLVTASRVLQWISDPGAAIDRMARVLKRGGILVALDYDHEQMVLDPAPPASFQDFYRAFLAWRAANSWDNRMALHLPAMFREAGLEDVSVVPSDEFSGKGEAASHIWGHVMESIGGKISQAGFYEAANLPPAKTEFEAYLADGFREQRLRLDTVTGRR